ncbi:MAG TPA: 2-dehydropantoate 2-reductase [Gaiellaceae bacterium]|nr:2-dehydropantoate 2-reductase [Gaiellaceae bacterium]
MKPRVCVVGAGVIGSLYAGHLAQVAEVSVLTRRAEHAAALERDGLRISGKSDLVARVTAADDASWLPDADLVILATKATEVEAAAERLADRMRGATVMTIQNGLGAEEIVARHGEWPLVSAVTFMSGVRHEDTHVEYELDTETWMGPYRSSFETVEGIERLLHESGLRARSFRDLRPAQWSKLIFNATVNTVAAVTNLPHVAAFAAVGADTDLGLLVRDLMDEGKRVASAAGVELHEDPWEMNVHAVQRGETEAAEGHYAHVPSMLEDIRSGRRTEVDFITGSLIREADRLGLDVPLHRAMYRLVRARETA